MVNQLLTQEEKTAGEDGHPCPVITLLVEVEGKLPRHTTVVLTDGFPPPKTPSVIRVNVHSSKAVRAATTGTAGVAVWFTHGAFLTEIAMAQGRLTPIITESKHDVVLLYGVNLYFRSLNLMLLAVVDVSSQSPELPGTSSNST